jgi:hypothetical protein
MPNPKTINLRLYDGDIQINAEEELRSLEQRGYTTVIVASLLSLSESVFSSTASKIATGAVITHFNEMKQIPALQSYLNLHLQPSEVLFDPFLYPDQIRGVVGFNYEARLNMVLDKAPTDFDDMPQDEDHRDAIEFHIHRVAKIFPNDVIHINILFSPDNVLGAHFANDYFMSNQDKLPSNISLQINHHNTIKGSGQVDSTLTIPSNPGYTTADKYADKGLIDRHLVIDQPTPSVRKIMAIAPLLKSWKDGSIDKKQKPPEGVKEILKLFGPGKIITLDQLKEIANKRLQEGSPSASPQSLRSKYGIFQGRQPITEEFYTLISKLTNQTEDDTSINNFCKRWNLDEIIDIDAVAAPQTKERRWQPKHSG